MKKKRLKRDDYGAMVLFYGFVIAILLGLSALGGCARPQPVVVKKKTEPPSAELMQKSALPSADTAEAEPLKRCVKNLANTRRGCGKIVDNHNGLQKYVREAVPSARRVQ